MNKISEITVKGTTYKIQDDNAYVKPSEGIPASDIEDGVIPDVSNFITRSVRDLTNYYTNLQTYTKDEINNLIGAINQFHYEVYASTDAVSNPQSNVIYLIGPSNLENSKYDEYVYSNGWVKIGDTNINLIDYVSIEQLNRKLVLISDTDYNDLEDNGEVVRDSIYFIYEEDE